jgi:hypothetical protein
MICKFCLSEKQLGDSHVIPRSFFPPTGSDPRPNRIISNRAGVFPQKSRTGVYDRTILCKKCEREFDRVDNYGQKILLATRSKFGRLFQDGVLVGYEFRHYDYQLLKQFFISVLWRAIVSSHPFFGRVNKMDAADRALQAFKSIEPIPSETFSVNLAMFDFPGDKILMDPYLTKIDEIDYAVFYLGGYIAYIKLEDAPTPHGLAEIMLSPERPLSIVAREFTTSREHTVIRNVSMLPINKF